MVTSPQSRNSQAISSYLPDGSTRFLQESVGILTRRSQQTRLAVGHAQGPAQPEQADLDSHDDVVLVRLRLLPSAPAAKLGRQAEDGKCLDGTWYWIWLHIARHGRPVLQISGRTPTSRRMGVTTRDVMVGG